jgi:hypothetical protein
MARLDEDRNCCSAAECAQERLGYFGLKDQLGRKLN